MEKKSSNTVMGCVNFAPTLGAKTMQGGGGGGCYPHAGGGLLSTCRGGGVVIRMQGGVLSACRGGGGCYPHASSICADYLQLSGKMDNSTEAACALSVDITG